MANIQSQFNKFHDVIKTDFDDNKPLRDQRDLIIDNLRSGLKRLIPTDTPTFGHFNQGSYDLATGVKPLSGEDYDIDVGIIFKFSKNSYQPVQVKQWVYNALKTGSRTVEIKRPCVRVQYQQNAAKWFHIDLAIYSTDRYYLGGNEVNHIAKGFIGSPEEKKFWEISEPFKLKELLKSKIADSSDRDQFRRIIRYLKRWKDYNFVAGRPTGIALTACCYNIFTPQKNYLYSFFPYPYDDLKALQIVVDGMIEMFSWKNQISVKLPVEPYNDLFEKMTHNQKESMKTKLIDLRAILISASNELEPSDACIKLRKVFGSDFPIS